MCVCVSDAGARLSPPPRLGSGGQARPRLFPCAHGSGTKGSITGAGDDVILPPASNCLRLHRSDWQRGRGVVVFYA